MSIPVPERRQVRRSVLSHQPLLRRGKNAISQESLGQALLPCWRQVIKLMGSVVSLSALGRDQVWQAAMPSASEEGEHRAPGLQGP